jgi:hypothetical protein
MGDFLDRPSATPTNPSMLHLLSRHKDILYDYTKEFRKVKVKKKKKKKDCYKKNNMVMVMMIKKHMIILG